MSNSTKSRALALAPAQAAPKPSITLFNDLIDHLSHADNAQKARLMLRSWFLAQALHADAPVTSNPGDIADNVYLYELLDDFFSGLLQTTPAQ